MSDDDLRLNAESTARLRALVGRLADGDLGRSLGGGWNVATALVHLAWWDVRQRIAIETFAADGAFPGEDPATNATLEALGRLFREEEAGKAAIEAAEALDAALARLPDGRRAALRAQGFAWAVARHRHREDHIHQIEGALR